MIWLQPPGAGRTHVRARVARSHACVPRVPGRHQRVAVGRRRDTRLRRLDRTDEPRPLGPGTRIDEPHHARLRSDCEPAIGQEPDRGGVRVEMGSLGTRDAHDAAHQPTVGRAAHLDRRVGTTAHREEATVGAETHRAERERQREVGEPALTRDEIPHREPVRIALAVGDECEIPTIGGEVDERVALM